MSFTKVCSWIRRNDKQIEKVEDNGNYILIKYKNTLIEVHETNSIIVDEHGEFIVGFVSIGEAFEYVEEMEVQ